MHLQLFEPSYRPLNSMFASSWDRTWTRLTSVGCCDVKISRWLLAHRGVDIGQAMNQRVIRCARFFDKCRDYISSPENTCLRLCLTEHERTWGLEPRWKGSHYCRTFSVFFVVVRLYSTSFLKAIWAPDLVDKSKYLFSSQRCCDVTLCLRFTDGVGQNISATN